MNISEAMKNRRLKRLSQFLDANREEALDESILDPIHKTLNKAVFGPSKKMLPKVRKHLTDVFEKWLEENGYHMDDVKRMELVGSSTGYQYSETSDLDVNCIVVGIQEDDIHAIWEQLPNGNDLPGTKHPIHYYLLPDGKDKNKYDAIYDILGDDWKKEAKKEDVKIPYPYVMHIAKFFMEAIDLRLAEYNRDRNELDIYREHLKEADIETDKQDIQVLLDQKKTEVKADLDSLWIALNMVHAFRGEAFDEEYQPHFLINITSGSPNYSVNNIVYKILERFGYVDELKDLKKDRDKIARQSDGV